MAHVVMQSAEFPTTAAAERAEAELAQLFSAYIEFEKNDPDPWSGERVPPPLIEFGRRHGVEWPDRRDARFLLKDRFEHAAELMRVDRMVFFWGGGFEMGGEPLREVLRGLGATRVEENCRLVIESGDPDTRVAQLVDFLEYEDFEDQFSLDPSDEQWCYFSLTVVGPNHARTICFDDSGVQDWAFVTLLPQIYGEDPGFLEEGREV